MQLRSSTIGKKPAVKKPIASKSKLFERRCVCMGCGIVFKATGSHPLGYCGCDSAIEKDQPKFSGLSHPHLRFRKGLDEMLLTLTINYVPRMKYTSLTTMNWLAVVLWNTGEIGIHNVVNIDSSHPPNGYKSLKDVMTTNEITIVEDCKSGNHLKFAVGLDVESPILELVPRDVVEQCVNDGTLDVFMAQLGLFGVKLFCKL
jgi:hypothetical protein